ncbi:hypothetical protein LGM63_05620 [Burkholderia cepacia]|uniref:hypothetical protein n=1 Tax=Burkholderia cepacia TaxID=292 RepID=UPI0018C49E6D|nr:hypothetical protein [Burkholderia cepacia]MCA7990111.1 hypothetical protein [Burkholderia cepacia]
MSQVTEDDHADRAERDRRAGHVSEKKAPRICEAAQRTHHARATLSRVDHRLRVCLDRRLARDNGVDLFVLTLKVCLHCRVARVDSLFQLREAAITRAQSFLDARRRRCVVSHSSPGNEKAARRRLCMVFFELDQLPAHRN